MDFLAEQSAFINAQVIPWVLRLVMLGLGLSLTLADFKRVLTFPRRFVLAALHLMPTHLHHVVTFRYA